MQVQDAPTFAAGQGAGGVGQGNPEGCCVGKCWFVSRHEGARVWLERQGRVVDRQVDHLDPGEVGEGDVVYGTLPVHLAAALCARGAQYHHLILDLPVTARGRELTADELDLYGARLVRFEVVAI